MANKKVLKDFVKNSLEQKETEQVKGGFSYVPTNSGSTGYINWNDIDIRDQGAGIPVPTVKASKYFVLLP